MAVTLEQLQPYVGKRVCMHYHDEEVAPLEPQDGMIGGVLQAGLDPEGYAMTDWGCGILPADITEIHLDNEPCSLYTEEDRKADEAADYAEHAPNNGTFL